MGRKPIWTAIHDTLAAEIARGLYAPGEQLPTEARLAERFGVNRHTIRRALAELAGAEVVHARRGAGVFVRHRPTRYPIGRRVRYHQNLVAAGRVPARRLLSLETRHPDPREAENLRLGPDARVHVFEGLGLADDTPITVFRSVFPAERFPNLPAALARTLSVTAAFAAEGVADYTRRATEITAKPAGPTIAGHLHLAPGAPVLRVVSLNVDAAGVPVEYGRSWMAGDRVALTLGLEELG